MLCYIVLYCIQYTSLSLQVLQKNHAIVNNGMYFCEVPIDGTVIPQYFKPRHRGFSMHPQIAYYYITVTNGASAVE